MDCCDPASSERRIWSSLSIISVIGFSPLSSRPMYGPLGFVGGGYMGQAQTNGRPIQTTPVPPGTPRWGAGWKSAVRDNYLSTVTPGTGVHGSFYSYRDVYLD